jgi:hypothetical protein
MKTAAEIECFFLQTLDNKKYVGGFVIDIFIYLPLETRNLIKEVLYFLPFYIKSKF